MLPALLAQFEPVSADWQAGLYAFGTLVALILSVMANFRRKPSVDVDLQRLVGSIDALMKAVEKLETSRELHAGHAIQIQSLENNARELRAQVDREIAGQRKYSMELSREIFSRIDSENGALGDKLDAMRDTMQKLFLDISGEIGGLREAVKHAQS
ncbi:hypothetical protein [Horticoccus sp. 23ND18S-11]|uniref:hypothetical protein n=1 Tax=Horticoccus sp. 23ND18S-11 TaxID=3391832 RepID=UPI0039C98113